MTFTYYTDSTDHDAANHDDDAKIKAKLAEVAAHYARQSKQAKSRLREVDSLTKTARFRTKDLLIVARFKFGPTIPDDASGWAWLKAFAINIAYTYRVGPRSGRHYFASHVGRLAPWLSDDEREALIEDAERSDDKGRLPTPFPNMDELGAQLGITIEMRDAWDLRNIGAISDSKSKRRTRRKAKDKARKAEQRRANGATPRAMSKARTTPWLSINMTRPTWYRRGRPTAPSSANSEPKPEAA